MKRLARRLALFSLFASTLLPIRTKPVVGPILAIRVLHRRLVDAGVVAV